MVASYATRLLRLSFLAPDIGCGHPRRPPAAGVNRQQAHARHATASGMDRAAAASRVSDRLVFEWAPSTAKNPYHRKGLERHWHRKLAPERTVVSLLASWAALSAAKVLRIKGI